MQSINKTTQYNTYKYCNIVEIENVPIVDQQFISLIIINCYIFYCNSIAVNSITC